MLEFKRKWKIIDDLHAFLNDIRLMDSGFGTFVSYAPTFFAKVNLSSHFSYLKKKTVMVLLLYWLPWKIYIYKYIFQKLPKIYIFSIALCDTFDNYQH